MPQTTYYEYNTSLGSSDQYKVKDASQTHNGLVIGSELGAGDEFVYGGKVYTYTGGADTGSSGVIEVGFFATTGSVAKGNLATHFFSSTPDTNGNTYYLDASQDYTVVPAPCFVRGTRLATPDGEVAVETLKVGDLVTTTANKETVSRPIKWVGQRLVNITSHPRPQTVEPIRIRRGAFADNMPHRDLLVSPDHAIFVEEKLICARQLVNGTTIHAVKGMDAVEYFHIELSAHAILLAEGLPAESYLNTGNSGFFVNSDQPLVLRPDLTEETDFPTREKRSCAPFVWDADSVWPVWQKLAERASTLDLPVPAAEGSTSPELCIIARGSTVKPVSVAGGIYQFLLPQGATEVRIVSRAASPCDLRPWMEDRRRLGVYAERIVVRGLQDVQEVPLDHPALCQGWWALERHGVEFRRWTDGDALLPLPVMDGPVLLEIRATSSGMIYQVGTSEQRKAA